MSDDDQPDIPLATAEPPLDGSDAAGASGEPPARPRMRKRRLLLLALPLAVLAGISTAFGMMMALAADLPNLESAKEFQSARNSLLYDRLGRPLGILTSDRNRVIVPIQDISPFMKNAIISVEDRRFYENDGVDLRGIGRAFYQGTIRGGARQGGSTITQQFVKNALEAQDERTVFQKLRESALAYHLTRRWSKQKILKEYLNSIYFGNGAYGIESAARVYFAGDPNYAGCGTRANPCARLLTAADAALLAGVVANPSAYDPVAHPEAAIQRRNLVLTKMLQEGKLTRAEYDDARVQALPGKITPPSVDTRAPYFTTWVSQQLVEQFGARRAFEGGLKVETTLDLDLQAAAQKAIDASLPNPAGPAAALVAIDNDTGEVRALVGGRNYRERPFNLATQGQRQPGSTVKPFILAEAMRKGYGIGSVWPSAKRVFTVPGTGGQEKFEVNNFDDAYAGARDLGSALTFSDNAVYAAAGISTGTKRIARFIERMGVRTPVSSNPAMTLGAFKQGVSVLDWAHAYETFATGGRRTSGTLGAPNGGPVGIQSVRRVSDDELVAKNEVRRKRVLSQQLADLTLQQMATVVSSGTGKRAAWGGFAAGKTGTTENFGDAWFVGITRKLTIAVWVGYPDTNTPMKTEFGGEPVAGGTFPAQIWRNFVLQSEAIFKQRVAERRAKRDGEAAPEATDPAEAIEDGVVESAGGEPQDDATGGGGDGDRAPSAGGGDGDGGAGGGGGGGGGNATPAPAPEPAPEPAPTPAPAPAPAPEPAPGGGSDGGGVSAPSG
ncbi:MAG: transglycosylase domain-containing protein [Solirubrobacteraceae bacterium]|nr:transglycosylase domain-containing protein [Solirubrobacteraceae bacterium]